MTDLTSLNIDSLNPASFFGNYFFRNTRLLSRAAISSCSFTRYTVVSCPQAIKKLSTRSREAKKSQNLTSWHSAIPDLETASLSWSLPSLDTKSIDTLTTYVAENSEDCVSSCCYCDEYEENQRNENIENEMII